MPPMVSFILKNSTELNFFQIIIPILMENFCYYDFAKLLFCEGGVLLWFYKRNSKLYLQMMIVINDDTVINYK